MRLNDFSPEQSNHMASVQTNLGTTSIEKMEDLVGEYLALDRRDRALLITSLPRLKAGVDLKLTDEEIRSIDEPYQARVVVGHL